MTVYPKEMQNIFLAVVFSDRTEHIDYVAVGEGFTVVDDMGWNNGHVASSAEAGFVADGQFHFSLNQVRDLLVGVRVSRKRATSRSTVVNYAHALAVNHAPLPACKYLTDFDLLKLDKCAHL